MRTTDKLTGDGQKQAQLVMQTSLQLLPLIMNNIPQAVFWKDRDLVYLGCNKAFAEDAGLSSPEEIIGKTDFDMPWRDQAELYRADDRQTMENGEPKLNYEEPQTTPNGSTIWLSTSKIPVYEDDQVVAVLGMYEDITARKQVEKAIYESEERFRRFTEATNEGLVFHEQGRIIDANPAALAMFGLSDSTEFIGKNLLQFLMPESHEMVLKHMQLETVLPYEVQCIHEDGSIFPVETSTRTYKVDDRTIRATSVRDITERKQAEEKIKAEEQRFQTIIESVRVPMLISRLSDRQVLYANQALADVSHVSLDKLIGFPTSSYYANSDDQKKVIENLKQHGYISDFETQFRRTDGSLYWALLSSRVINYQGEACVLSSYVDITALKQAEKTVRDSEDRFRRFTEATVEGLVFHEQGKIIDTNPAAVSMFGFSGVAELIGRNLLEFIVPESHALVLKQMQLESVLPYEIQGIRGNGTTFPIETTTRAYKIGNHTIRASSIRDITDRKRAEQALRESQQLLQIVMDNIPQSIFWKDSQLTYLGCNSAFAADAGLASPRDIVGKTDWDMPWKEQAELYRADDRLVMKSGTPKLNYEEPQTTPDGTTTWLRTSKVPLRDTDGNVAAVLGMYEDITERKNLEQQIQKAFERRGRQVQLSTQVSQSIATSPSLEELYQRVVTQVKEQFGYYHTQILRYDAAQEAVVLVTGYGETGAKMLAAGHRLPMGEGLIGTAAATGEKVLRSVLENDPDWHPNPLLPETKGEIAVPIKLGDNILGVLDVQSSVAGALGADDQLLLEGLCGQIAIAIESTRLRQEMAERLEEINRLYRAMSHEGWKSYRETANFSQGFIFDQIGIRPIDDTCLAEELFANLSLTAPGGEVVGSLSVADDPQRPLDTEDQALFEQVSEQVALALESARLFEQTQIALGEVRRRAQELATVATVSTTASRALDPEELLQTVVDLTKERFGIYHAHIYLVDESSNILTLAAGAGKVGRQMVADGWNIPIDHALSMVASAARSRQSVINNNITHDKHTGFLSNYLLTDTRSEMAVPMIVGEKLLGVFDIQADKTGYFVDEDANIYTTLAAQVGVALQNARLYESQLATVDQLRELDRLKSSFLANMSHELRTPLNSILGFSDVMLEELDGPLTEMMDNDLRLIQKNGQHLLHLINDVLDMAKIDAGRLNLHPEQFNVHKLIEEVISITSSLANEKSLILTFDEDSDEEVEICADRTRIQQVMINLVNNAIKFTPAGTITINVAHQNEKVNIRVSDTGIGIRSDYLETIFQEFAQVDTSATRKTGGTGLGLPISRRLIGLHGGRLWAESSGVPGEGSIFYVELPIKAEIEQVEKLEK